MTEESHPPGSGWPEEISSKIDNDNIDKAATLDKPENDHPLTFHFKEDHSRIERLGLPRPRSKRIQAVQDAILTDARLAHARGKAVSYSRNNNFYSSPSRYRALPFTRTNVFDTVERLLEHELIEEERARQGDHLRTQMQSRFWATPKLVHLWGEEPAAVIYDPHETIQLRNGDGELIDYDDTERSRRRRKDMREYNEAMASTDIVLDAPDVHWNPMMVRVPTEKGELVFPPSRKTSYRVFKGGWERGGRLYGAFYQSLPKSRRLQLLMNGKPVVEYDHSQIHARLLYAESGLQVDGDAYTVPGHEERRPLFKVAWQIMINASDRRSGVWALASDLAAKALELSGELIGLSTKEIEWRVRTEAPRFQREASSILDLLETRHWRVKKAFYTGAGIRLQYIDAEMCMRLVKQTLKEGIVVGSVHDSHFSEIGRNSDRMIELMDDGMAMATNRPKAYPVRLPASSVLHMV